MYIPRDVERALEATLTTRKVLLLLGARQVGKTTLAERLVARGRDPLLNMDIEVDRVRVTAAAKLAPREALRSLGAENVLIIDEAHRVPDIGRIVKGWYDARVPTKIILLGSSSATLLDVAAAELTGRNEKLWLTPLLFREVLQHQAWWSAAYTPQQLARDFADQVRTLLVHRLVYGSYPEAYLSTQPEQYLTNLSGDYLLKDIFTGSLVRSPDDVRRLLLELAQQIGSTVSVLQLANRLRLSRQTVTRYLDLLENIFVIFSLPAYYTDVETEVTKSRKYYFWDTGVKNALQREWVVSESRSDMAALWQNWVISEIFKQARTFGRHEDLFFWQSRNGSTVDLVVKQGEQLHAFDLRWRLDDAQPSRGFKRLYDVPPVTIHPGNVTDYLL